MKFAVIVLATVLACVVVELNTHPLTYADSVILKNGSRIEGAARQEDGVVTVTFGNNGFVQIPASQVVKIVANDLDEFAKPKGTPAATSMKPVVVTMKAAEKGHYEYETGRYGTGRYVGRIAASSDDRALVLTTAGGGTLKINRDDVAQIKEVEKKNSRPEGAVEGTIRTTHLITLKNGRRLRGNVMTTSNDQPARISVGGLGVMTIRRDRIDKIEAVEGTIEVAPAHEASGKVDEPPPPAHDDEIKARLRREILDELLETLIERKLATAVDEGARDLSLQAVVEQLPAETIQDIQYHVRELGRHRSAYRVRAEDHLKRFGFEALPYLEPAATHPFELTRRAVQRIVRKAGDLRGVPYAINGLNDPDFFVRKLAHEALLKLLGDEGIVYNPSDRPAQRASAQGHYRTLWNDVRREYVREVVSGHR